MPNPEPGEMYLTPRGKWAVKAPLDCPNGHWLGPGRVLVGSEACTCLARHMGWFCRECGVTVYRPEKGPDCDVP